MIAFKPCPVCGRPLTTKDVRFFDCDSLIGDMDMISDFEHVLDPSNSCYPEDWKNLDEKDRQQIGRNYRECVEAVETIIVMCDCGLSIAIDRWSIPFPDAGWLDEFAAKINRRASE